MTPIRILYVEDNEALLETIGALLEASDREVVLCSSGEEAVTLWAEQPFDVLITDVSLPGISGTALARRILSDAPRQWVVLCSGYAFPGGLASLGPNVRALLKPFEMDELDRLMDEIRSDLRGAPSAG